MSDRWQAPYKATFTVMQYDGDWTAEEIDAGLAGDPVPVSEQSAWYEPTPEGPVLVTDPVRIAELEQKSKE